MPLSCLLICLDNVADIFKSTMGVINDKPVLHKARMELDGMTPLPIHTMLEKQSKEDAISKQQVRWSLDAVDVPPTNPG